MIEHLADVVAYVSGEDESDLAKIKAELGYALHCLEREMAICAKVDARNDALVEALVEARMALFKIRACSIVGCEQGYGKPELWADALFASHGDVAKALKTIDAALPQPASVVGGAKE